MGLHRCHWFTLGSLSQVSETVRREGLRAGTGSTLRYQIPLLAEQGGLLRGWPIDIERPRREEVRGGRQDRRTETADVRTPTTKTRRGKRQRAERGGRSEETVIVPTADLAF